MKRLIILSSLLVFVAMFSTVTALMQDRLRPQLNDRDDLQQMALGDDGLADERRAVVRPMGL
jgi:hypothetical protein